MGEEVTELRALAGDVVDHEVEHDVVIHRQRLDVRPCPEAGVDLAMGERREASIA